MDQRYDLVVIGGGSGGVRAARMSATYGARVAIIEEYRMGGTCVIRGCVPKKLFAYASRFHESFEIAESYGWSVNASFDWSVLKANKDKEIARLERAYTAGLDGAGVEIIKDRAVITGPNTVQLQQAGTTLEAKTILVAAGGRPFVPDIPGAEYGMTSNEAFELEALPHSILIEGGGYIAVEFANIFAGLGVHVTLLYRGDCILRGFEDELRRGLEDGLVRRGIKLIYETNLLEIRKSGDDLTAVFSDGIEAPFGAIMFGTGRRANTEGLGLDTVGVELNEDGTIPVDTYSRTTCPSVYAVGDITGRAALTPVAIREGAAFAETLFNDNPTEVDLSQLATAVFADPEIGTIGLTEKEAATHGDIDIYLAQFRPMINTLTDRTERMIFKLITDGNSGKVLGCHILGPGAAELIQLVAVPMGMGATKADFNRAIAVHPTAAEELVTFKKPTYSYRGGKRVG
ncbi:glutathione-disulfide reductase [Devosia pacifica]|uniref:Glutathione-disulfide reductase n=1 Tax=Devosia pacifica TaxID=1335967 RepID=A0A918SAB1_9HYPH|nr:glutathione-disulfide reductase [Devosia pacifica]GHA28984.1 glutathione-disulfide reductase [Devosia pacifica]